MRVKLSKPDEKAMQLLSQALHEALRDRQYHLTRGIQESMREIYRKYESRQPGKPAS